MVDVVDSKTTSPSVAGVGKSPGKSSVFRILFFICLSHPSCISLQIPGNACLGVKKYIRRCVGMVDEEDSKSFGGDIVWVRVPPPAPNQYNPNQIFPVGDGFGLFVFFGKFEETHFRNGVVKRPESKPRGPRKKKQI